MKAKACKSALAATLLTLAGCAAAPVEPPVEVAFIGVSPEVRLQLQEAAAKGRTELLRYVKRNRLAHYLRIVRPVEAAALAGQARQPERIAVTDSEQD